MLLQPLTKNICPRLFSARVERPAQFKIELQPKQKKISNEQNHNQKLISIMKRFNGSPMITNIIQSQGKNQLVKTITKNPKKTLFRGKLPQLKGASEVELKKNSKLKKDLNDCFGSPVTWLKHSKKIKDEPITIIPEKKCQNSINQPPENIQQFKPLILLNRFSNCCNNKRDSNPNSRFLGQEKGGNSEIEESIVSISGQNIPIIHLESSSNLNDKSERSSLFKTLSRKMEMDPLLHKTYAGEKITWNPGEIIFEGSSSIIYKALNEETGQFLVVKRYIDRKQLDTFNTEVKIYSQAKHFNVIKYLGSEKCEKTNSYFIYLEFASGGNLKQLIDSYGYLKEKIIKRYLSQILSILEYLHKEKHIVHRDIKCSNILLDSEGNIKLSDFGCAEIDPEDSFSGLKGTLPWCAPEVIKGGKYGLKCDIWSLGCTIVEMGGLQPWGGKIDNYYQCINIIGNGNDTPKIPDYFSDNLKDFLTLCFKRDPNERASATELKNHKLFLEN